MLSRLQMVMFVILLVERGHGEWPEEVLLDDGRGIREFRVACDELYCRPPDALPHLIAMPEQGGAREISRLANEQGEHSGARFDLVLYEKGRDRSPATRRTLSRRILVRMDGEVPAEAIAAAAAAESFVVPEYARDFLIVKFPAAGDSLDRLGEVRGLAGVASAAPLLGWRKVGRHVPDDPRYAWSASNTNYQWHLNNTGQNGSIAGLDVNVAQVWDDFRGAGVTVAVVDDGLQVAHPDLAPNANTSIDHDWNDGTPDDPTPPSGGFWDHGTSVAGVIAGRGDNGIGVTGAAPMAGLVGLKILTADTTEAEDAEALGWRTDIVDISNNSWGEADDGRTLFSPQPLVRAALEDAVANGRGGRGTIYVWSAGNGRDDGDYANYDGYVNRPETIGVGAINYRGEQSWYSESGANVLISAPSDGDFGEPGITTTTLTGLGSYRDDFGGTSSAAPLVSGVVALLLESNPELGWRDVQEILIRSARRVSPEDSGWSENGAGFQFHHGFGAGMVDAAAAVALGDGWENLAPQASVGVTDAAIGAVIPDGDPAGITRTLSVSGESLRVEHVLLTVDIEHSRRGQLVISLTSPTGMVSQFSEVHNDTGDDYSNYTFLSVRHWGELSGGEWSLEVRDDVAGTAGVLRGASLQVLGAPELAGYPAWVAAEFPDGAVQVGELDDPDCDGRNNLLEYAFGSDPLVPDAGPATGIEIVEVAGGFRIRYVANTANSDLDYRLECSADLGAWQPLVTEVVSADGNLETREAIVPASGRSLYRLAVIR